MICTDVLEHCPTEDIPWIVDELFGFARQFVYASIASFQAIKTLPNGENAHCTVRSLDWWDGLLHGIASRHPGVRYRVSVSSKVERKTILGRGRKPLVTTMFFDNHDQLVAAFSGRSVAGFRDGRL